ncbi:MAG: TatD family hydrolase, partial [Acidobacteriaceae bacterium]|nr:TatD family hydrolase [Acidobacteriaceae bacterium]
MTWSDSHCHLDSKEFDADREAVIERALEAGVARMVTIGTGDGPPDLEAGLRLAERYSCFLATVGVHPHDAAKATPQTYKHLAELLKHPKCVAMGEIGLDYHYDFSPRDTQRAVFIEQMQLAANARKPIVIHTREAWDDTFLLLERHWKDAGVPGIMHCFSGGPEEAQRALDLGFMLSFGGIVTYPKALGVQEAAKSAPLDRILIETDAPYLAPIPKRGKRNEPALVVHTAARIAELRGITAQELAEATNRNLDSIVTGLN